MTRRAVSCLLLVLLIGACDGQPSAGETVEAALEQAAGADTFHSRITGSAGDRQLVDEVISTGDSRSIETAFIEDGQHRVMLSVRRIGDEVFVLDARTSPDASWDAYDVNELPEEYERWIEAFESPYAKEDPLGVAMAQPDGFVRVDGGDPSAPVYKSRTTGVMVPMAVVLDEQGRVRKVEMHLGTSSVVIEILSYDPDASVTPQRPETRSD